MTRKRVYTAANKAIAQARFAKESTNYARDIARKSKFPKSIAAYHPNKNDWPGVDTPGSAIPGSAAAASKSVAKAKTKTTGKRKRSATPRKPRKKRAKSGSRKPRSKTTKKGGKKATQKRKKTKRAKSTKAKKAPGPLKPLADGPRKDWHTQVRWVMHTTGLGFRDAAKKVKADGWRSGQTPNQIYTPQELQRIYNRVNELRARRPSSLSDEEYAELIKYWGQPAIRDAIGFMPVPGDPVGDYEPVVPLPVNPPQAQPKIDRNAYVKELNDLEAMYAPKPVVKLEPVVAPKGILKIRKHDIPMVDKTPYELHKEVQRNLLGAKEFEAMRRAKISSANFRLQQYVNSKGGRLKTNSALWAERPNRRARFRTQEGELRVLRDRQRGMTLFDPDKK